MLKTHGKNVDAAIRDAIAGGVSALDKVQAKLSICYAYKCSLKMHGTRMYRSSMFFTYACEDWSNNSKQGCVIRIF